MSRSYKGSQLFITCSVLWACSTPRIGGSDEDAALSPAVCDGSACERSPQATEKLDGSTDSSHASPTADESRSDARSDASEPSHQVVDDAAQAPSPLSPPGAADIAVDGSNHDAGSDANAPVSATGSFCSNADGVDFCSDFESSEPEAGFDYSAVHEEDATTKLVEANLPGHDRHVLELGLSGPASAKYVHDFADGARSIRIEFDVWVKTAPGANDDFLEVAKLQQEVPPDHYLGVSLLVHAQGAGVLVGNLLSQADGGSEYAATTFDLPPLGDKWTRVQLDTWPGPSGRVRVSYDGIEVLNQSGVRIYSDNTIKTYASIGLYSSKIETATVWYDNVIVDTDF